MAGACGPRERRSDRDPRLPAVLNVAALASSACAVLEPVASPAAAARCAVAREAVPVGGFSRGDAPAIEAACRSAPLALDSRPRSSSRTWRIDFNTVRPHRSLDGTTPSEYAIANRGLSAREVYRRGQVDPARGYPHIASKKHLRPTRLLFSHDRHYSNVDKRVLFFHSIALRASQQRCLPLRLATLR